jgi:hypothetical protein
MMQMLGVKPFGPTGVVNNNNLSSVGQGLKKIFKPQPEYPRMFSSDDGGDSPKQKRGSNSGLLPTFGCPCLDLTLEDLLGFFGDETYLQTLEGGIYFTDITPLQTQNGSVFRFDLLSFLEDQGNEDENYPEDGGLWKRRNACLRFVCRCVSGNSVSQTVFGGPTTYDRDIWSEILEPRFGFENSSGNYLYLVNFQGWERQKNKNYPISTRAWISDDTFFFIYKYSLVRV